MLTPLSWQACEVREPLTRHPETRPVAPLFLLSLSLGPSQRGFGRHGWIRLRRLLLSSAGSSKSQPDLARHNECQRGGGGLLSTLSRRPGSRVTLELQMASCPVGKARQPMPTIAMGLDSPSAAAQPEDYTRYHTYCCVQNIIRVITGQLDDALNLVRQALAQPQASRLASDADLRPGTVHP